MFEIWLLFWHSFLEYRTEHPVFVNSAIFIGLVVASGFIGHWLAKALRAADYGWKFGVILFAILASVVVIVRGWPPKLGVDLGGGSILVYKVDETKTEWRPEKMDSLLASISKRVNPGGQKEISVQEPGHRHGGDRHAQREREHGQGEAGRGRRNPQDHSHHRRLGIPHRGHEAGQRIADRNGQGGKEEIPRRFRARPSSSRIPRRAKSWPSGAASATKRSTRSRATRPP